jgi:hypothetical protein
MQKSLLFPYGATFPLRGKAELLPFGEQNLSPTGGLLSKLFPREKVSTFQLFTYGKKLRRPSGVFGQGP